MNQIKLLKAHTIYGHFKSVCPTNSGDLVMLLFIPFSHRKLSCLKSGVSNSSAVSLPINRE